ncbi:MAG: hypothetical protein JWO82_773 [Akkermansiaceae bacterium]|nr:hypothetical protein [Akkermansiaceae bacterium]
MPPSRLLDPKSQAGWNQKAGNWADVEILVRSILPDGEGNCARQANLLGLSLLG